MNPYISISGFMTRDEVRYAHDRFINTTREGCALMIGVNANKKTLCGKPAAQPNRFPLVETIAHIFRKLPQTLNMIAYAPAPDELSNADLDTMVRLGGSHLHGFQLDVCWPSPHILERHRRSHNHTLVLKIGVQALAECEHSGKRIATKLLTEYRGLVDGILIDFSGANGKSVHREDIGRVVEPILSKMDELVVGIAGGLDECVVRNLTPELICYPVLGLHADRKLRDADDYLDLKAVRGYISAALAALMLPRPQPILVTVEA